MSDQQGQHEVRRRPLLQAFPRLLHGGLPYLEFGRGWDGIIHGLLQDIDELLHDEQATAFRVVQIKEKFGTLRLYYRVRGQRRLHVDVQDGQGLPLRLVVGEVTSAFPCEEIDRLIAQAEEMTAQTCEGCGQPGSLRCHAGWYTTLCDACLAARNRERQQEDG